MRIGIPPTVMALILCCVWLLLLAGCTHTPPPVDMSVYGCAGSVDADGTQVWLCQE